MIKNMELAQVRRGESFILDGVKFVKLDEDAHASFVLTADVFSQTHSVPRIRLGDKFSRFKTLSRILSSDSDQQAVTDESIRDTLLDLANYSIMTVLEIDDAQHEQEIAEQKTCDEGASDAD